MIESVWELIHIINGYPMVKDIEVSVMVPGLRLHYQISRRGRTSCSTYGESRRELVLDRVS